jgi:hypothetical protein
MEKDSQMSSPNNMISHKQGWPFVAHNERFHVVVMSQ